MSPQAARLAWLFDHLSADNLPEMLKLIADRLERMFHTVTMRD